VSQRVRYHSEFHGVSFCEVCSYLLFPVAQTTPSSVRQDRLAVKNAVNTVGLGIRQ
jgi:hypothetical protein